MTVLVLLVRIIYCSVSVCVTLEPLLMRIYSSVSVYKTLVRRIYCSNSVCMTLELLVRRTTALSLSA